jgi:peptidoglycan/LPS O-acetylase OafA/YrhL
LNFINKELRPYPELDTIRFISVTLVVCHHLFFKNNSFLAWMHDYAWVGVDIFFTLSGFLITGLLMKELDKSGTIDLKKFWVKRMIRLWPCWLIALLISFIFTYYFGQNNPEIMGALKEKFWHYILHLGNYSYAFYGKLHTLFGHYWSLAVEEHFYLIWPMVMLLVFKKQKLKPLMLTLLLFLPYLLRVGHHHVGFTIDSITLSTHTRIDSIVWGCLLAYGFKNLKDLSVKKEIVYTGAMFILYALSLHYLTNNKAISPWLSEIGRTTISMASCLFIIIAMKGNNNGLRRVLRNPTLSWLGIMSYGVYLFHVHTNSIIFAIITKYIPDANLNVVAIIANIAPYIPAIGTYYLIDKQLHKKRSVILEKLGC